MSGDSLTNLVSFIPTILALAIIVINMFIGFVRGFKKTAISLIQYISSLIVGIIVFFQVIDVTYSDNLGGLLSLLGPKFSGANSLIDAARIALEMFLPNFAGAANNAYLQQFIYAIAGLVINLVLAVICLVLVPMLFRFIFSIVVLICEKRIRRTSLDFDSSSDIDETSDVAAAYATSSSYISSSDVTASEVTSSYATTSNVNNSGRDMKSPLLGLAMGALRGFVSTILIVSFVTSGYFVLSGGISKNEETVKIEILGDLGSSIGVDIEAIYQGIRKSRTTGIGLVFDVIKIENTPIDLYYTDLFTISTFTSPTIKNDKVSPVSEYLSSDEVLKGEIAKLSLRAEGALLFDLLNDILQTNAIKIVNGQVKIDRTILDSDISVMVDEYITNSVVYSDLTPLAIIGVADAINKGEIIVDNSIKELFTDETIEEIKKIDFAKDISSLLTTVITAAELIPVNEETNDFDVAALKDVNTLLHLDVDKVKDIFNSLSKIKTLTKVVLPVGVGSALNTMESEIAAAGIDSTELDFSETDWSFELANLGNVYEKLAALDLDGNKLVDTAVNEETGLVNSLQYIIDLCNDETMVDGVEQSEIFKEKLTILIDTVFESDLLSQVGLVAVKSKIAELDFQEEDGTPSSLNDSFAMVKENLSNYTKEHLRLDLHELVSSCLDVTSLIPVFMGKDNDLFGKLYDINTDDLRSALLGTENSNGERTGGIYGLRLLSGDLNGDGIIDDGCKFATDSLIENALITYGQSIVSSKTVDSITEINDPTDPNYDFDAWPTELNALIGAIADLQTIDEDILTGINMDSSDLTSILPKGLTNENVDIISGAASKSKLLSGIIIDKLITNLEDDPTLGSTVSNPEIEWMDTVVKNDNGELEIVERGEFNNVLKAFIVFSDEEKAMELSDPNSLINGLAQLIKPATSESLSENVLDGLDYEEANYFASSQVLMSALSSKISEFGSGSESGFSLVIPTTLDTNANADAWKDWAYDNATNRDRKKGEFAKLVLVLYNAKEYAELNKNETTEEENEKPALNQDNILDSVVNMNKDACIVDSLVLYATMSNELMKQDNGTNSIIRIRECAKVLDPAANNGIEVAALEIDKALDVIRNLDMNLTTTGFSDVGIGTFLDAIKDPYDGEMTRQSICESNIFNITIISKVAETKDMSIPSKYKMPKADNPSELEVNLEAADWYPVAGAWENCELNRLLLSICELGISDDGKGGISIPNTNDILVSINAASDYTAEATKLDVIYASDILAQTVTDKVEEQKKNGLLIREEAAYDGVSGYLRKEEISILASFISESGINIESDNINASLVFDLIQGDPKFRMYICTSNILNYTTVDKIGDNYSSSTLAFPSSYLTVDNKVDKLSSLWYPASDETWYDCELNRLLVGIVDLEVGASGNSIDFPINEKMDTLLSQSKVEPLDAEGNVNTKLDIIYRSDIMAMTISRKLNETGSNGIAMPTVKYNGSTVYSEVSGRIVLDDKVIIEDEVELLLVGVMKVLGMTFDKDGFEYDNILSTVEISKLLSDYADGKTRLEALLESSILHFIISDNLISQNQIFNENGESKTRAIVTSQYYSNSSISSADITVVNKDGYIIDSEIINSIKALNAFGIESIKDTSTINLGHLKTYFGSGATNKDLLIEQVCSSAIVSKMFGQILVSNNILMVIDDRFGSSYMANLKTVLEANDNEEVKIVASADLAEILDKYGAVFDII